MRERECGLFFEREGTNECDEGRAGARKEREDEEGAAKGVEMEVYPDCWPCLSPSPSNAAGASRGPVSLCALARSDAWAR